MSRILVVDDSLSDRRIAGGLLTNKDGHSVEYANNGLDALEQIELHLPDLVLTDLQMPEMNGLELVQKIRDHYPLIPTILMTAQGSENIAVQALEQGAASYVPKKHLATDLCQTVSRVLAASDDARSFTRLYHRTTETKYVLENDLALLSSLVSHLRQDIRKRRYCDDTESIRVASGIDEALLNAYYHGNLEVDSELKIEKRDAFYHLADQRSQEQPYRDRQISVTVRFSPTEAVFIIRDEGPGFNPEELPDSSDPEYLQRPSGRGLLLMRAFLDEVKFNETGNEVTLVKRKREKPFVVLDENEN